MKPKKGVLAANVRIVRKFSLRETGVIAELYNDSGYIKAVEGGEKHWVPFYTSEAAGNLKVLILYIITLREAKFIYS